MPRPVIAVINGPNLNLLGERQPEIYGTQTLADIERECVAHADGLGLDVDFRQSNTEGDLVTMIQDLRHSAGLVINAAAYTHTSIAIRDALTVVTGPVIEVHLSNVYAREDFRRHSYIGDIATGVIAGCGAVGYRLAVTAIASMLENQDG
ncbi:MAG: type II 3-dehydroquinate dehydratase [Actinomycetota bacterium]|nr:type II 3-dehydroquinate dehydratase [Actinomycetota bacterium]